MLELLRIEQRGHEVAPGLIECLGPGDKREVG